MCIGAVVPQLVQVAGLLAAAGIGVSNVDGWSVYPDAGPGPKSRME
jgi:hypothetical protein